MNTREETKMIEQKVVTYVADDGTEFKTESECKDYETKQFLEHLIEAAEKLRITELDEHLPLSNDGLMNENNTFRWYKLNNETDFETVNKAYGNSLNMPESYPEIMCVETVGYEAYINDAYSYNMKTCKKITENFWKELGVKVTFEENQKYGIEISYSWGDCEDELYGNFANPEEAFEEMCNMAAKEAYVQNEEFLEENTCAIYFNAAKKGIDLHYDNDNTWCYYRIKAK